MNNETKGDVDALAEKIARDIFQLGDEPNSPATRMQYNGGEWPAREINQGGIGEKSLAEFIAISMRKHLTPTENPNE